MGEKEEAKVRAKAERVEKETWASLEVHRACLASEIPMVCLWALTVWACPACPWAPMAFPDMVEFLLVAAMPDSLRAPPASMVGSQVIEHCQALLDLKGFHYGVSLLRHLLYEY